MADAKFPKGIIFKLPNDNAPTYVKGNVSIKRLELIEWLSNEVDEWINLQAKVSQEGKAYFQVDTWKPNKKQEPVQEQKPQKENLGTGPESEDIPF